MKRHDSSRADSATWLTRWAQPRWGRRSTYTVLGFLGYAVASTVGAVLAIYWGLPLEDRAVALVGPPVAFIIVVTCASALKGREWIVFYQATAGAVICVAALGVAIDGAIARLLDITMLGIGVFLVFGRLGCFHVACCHGRLARRGVVYGLAHVTVGFWPRWRGRPLVPVQLIESAASLLLVIAGLAASATPGTAALVYAIGYAVLRFGLELLRGDPVRPFALGLSEAQWWCIATLTACLCIEPSLPTVLALLAALAAAGWLIAHRLSRELVSPPHLHELDAICLAVARDLERRDSRLGVGVSLHRLPDGRNDWILSSTHPRWSVTTARRIARSLWLDPEVVEGRMPGVVHVVELPRYA